MGNETAAAPSRTSPSQGYAFTMAESQAEIVEAIQQVHATGCAQIALVTIHFFSQAEETGYPSLLSDERLRQGSVSLLQSIRSLVRRTDQVFLHQHTCYFILLGANEQGAEIVEERLWEALLWRVHNMGEQEALRPAQLAIGHGAFPIPHVSPDELLLAASEFSKRFDGRSERAWQAGAGHTVHENEQTQQEEKEELPQLARKLGIPYLTFLPHQLPQRVLQAVNARLARELRCYPVGRERNMLTVAMLNPQDHSVLERLRQETGLRIFPVLTHPEALEMALQRFQ